ncbi:MAG: Kelch repeat-containing protein, partial [Gemmataceae bacterium]
MTNSLSIRNPEPLKTSNKATLSVEVDSQGVSPLVLVVPLGEGSDALMKPSEFRDKLKISVAKAEGAKAALDAKLSSPDRRVDATKPNRGLITLTRMNPSEQARFCVLLSNFTTNAAAGSAKLQLEDKDQKALADKTVTISDAKPRITKFVSTQYIFVKGTTPILSWETSPPGPSRLWRLSDNTEIAPKQPGGQEAEAKAGDRNFTRYRLDAMQGQAVTDSRILTLFSYARTQVRSYIAPGNEPALGLSGAEILGIYNYRNRLYAVVRNADPEKGASIWRSDIGFDPESWFPLTFERNGKKTPIMIPADAAARPGVVFDDKLYFMGGSSYDANLPGAEVGYFHFEANTWVDGEAVREEAWPKDDMPARMGHALLASPDGRRLWVAGGYNGDGGALNDVWVYDKDAAKWQKYQAAWEPRCLFGATFAGPNRQQLFIAGGFDSPGGYPTYDDIWRCDTTATNPVWSKLNYNLRRDPKNRIKQYSGCALAPLGEKVYALAAYRDVGEGATPFLVRINFANNEWVTGPPEDVGSDWVTETLDCYR